MDGRPLRKELQSTEVFLRGLREEVSVSRDYGLPVTVLVAVVEGGWSAEDLRKALDVLRFADLATLLEPRELAVALPNTTPEGAGAVEERLRKVVPGVRLASAAYRQDETAESLLARARRMAAGSGG
ncbi:MAG: hypothetical protein H0V53_09395 [Rubrobacter sp.]|nr:hypothetical protein [Rubrobacter sp.]